MPNLDGVSATSQIRQFDGVTPIISMTSNTTAHDIMTYFANGMNDILPKPFSRASLLNMLEKHLQHLRFIKLGEGTATPSVIEMNGGHNNNSISSSSSHSDASHHQLGMSDGGMMILNGVDSSLGGGGTERDGGRDAYGGRNDLKQINEDTSDISSYNLQSLSYEEMMDSMERVTQDYTRSHGHPASRKHSIGGNMNSNNTHHATASSMPPSSSGYTTNSTATLSSPMNHLPQSDPYGGGSHTTSFSSNLDASYGHQQHSQQQQQQQQQHQQDMNLLSIKSESTFPGSGSLLSEDSLLDQSQQQYLSSTLYGRKRSKIDSNE